MVRILGVILLIHYSTALFWWPFGGIKTNSRTITYGLDNFFENFFTPGWKPIFGISHSKKIEFGKGGKYQHGINFNIGPKPKFQPDLESLEFNALQDRQRTKRVLKSMTKPYFRRGRHNYNRL